MQVAYKKELHQRTSLPRGCGTMNQYEGQVVFGKPNTWKYLILVLNQTWFGQQALSAHIHVKPSLYPELIGDSESWVVCLFFIPFLSCHLFVMHNLTFYFHGKSSAWQISLLFQYITFTSTSGAYKRLTDKRIPLLLQSACLPSSLPALGSLAMKIRWLTRSTRGLRISQGWKWIPQRSSR